MGKFATKCAAFTLAAVMAVSVMAFNVVVTYAAENAEEWTTFTLEDGREFELRGLIETTATIVTFYNTQWETYYLEKHIIPVHWVSASNAGIIMDIVPDIMYVRGTLDRDYFSAAFVSMIPRGLPNRFEGVLSDLFYNALDEGRYSGNGALFNLLGIRGLDVLAIGADRLASGFQSADEIFNPANAHIIVFVNDLTRLPNAPDNLFASEWARDGINRAYNLGLLPTRLASGYTQPATRADFASFAVALYEKATGSEITGRLDFEDTHNVNDGNWRYGTDLGIRKMGYLGIISGVGDGNAAPNGTLTREQAAVILVRLANAIGRPLPPSAPTFTDNANISSWAVDSIGQIQAAGIMGGVGDNHFDPQGTFTREQSLLTLLRLYDMLN